MQKDQKHKGIEDKQKKHEIKDTENILITLLVDEICVIPRVRFHRHAARRTEKVLHTLVVQNVK